jgi:hypothetical protein
LAARAMRSATSRVMGDTSAMIQLLGGEAAMGRPRRRRAPARRGFILERQLGGFDNPGSLIPGPSPEGRRE